MKYTVVTLFPEIIDAYFATSIMAKAIQRGIIQYQPVNIRDFALDRHKTCDDAPYGGGPGMLMLPEPLGRALEAAGCAASAATAPKTAKLPMPHNLMEFAEQTPRMKTAAIRGGDHRAICRGGRRHEGGSLTTDTWSGEGGTDSNGAASPQMSGNSPPSQTDPRVIYLSPSGRPFTQELARELAAGPELVLLCGRYEGIDQRIIDLYIDDEISTGDYVLSSGEVAALAIIDATYRLVDDVIRPESLAEESFSGGLLEYPQYTRPELYDTMKVPDVLLSGHHEHIRRWRLEKQVEKTLRVRPDLIRRGRELGLFTEEIHSIIDRKVSAEGEA